MIYTLIDLKNGKVFTFENFILASIEAQDREGSKLYMSKEISGETLYPAKELVVQQLDLSINQRN
jgi:hypothetical protein